MREYPLAFSIRKASAFSLTEILICITIIAIIASLAFPAFSAAKLASQKSKSISNLHQIHILLQLYRADYDSRDQGNLYELGLPPYEVFSSLTDKYSLRPPLGGRFKGFGEYYLLPLDASASAEALRQWKSYSETCQGQIAVVADFNFSEVNPDDFSMYLTKRALGVTLDGNVLWKSGFGFPFMGRWWGCSSHAKEQ
jgi:prepilin-type N-terminal cleavage/methylation domain-containing protein